MAKPAPGKIMADLEPLAANPDPQDFIKPFLKIYGIPAATLNRQDRNIAVIDDDFGLARQAYFRPVAASTDLFEALDQLLAEPVIEANRVRFAIVTDFNDLVAVDRKIDERLDCGFADLARHYSFFLPLAGYEVAQEASDSPADAKAAERMGKLCDLLRKHNDVSDRDQAHQLHVFLTRLLFCLFAEDTDIFDKQRFTDTLRTNTGTDGSDTADFLRELFQVLNDPDRSGRYPAHLEAFPYVNGDLFAEDVPVPAMTGRARRLILEAGDLDWTGINPDIFGSMFQSVLDAEQRGTLGQHYTSYSNIMKVLRPLFLDDLETELEAAQRDGRSPTKRLDRFLLRLSEIKVFDPACGSGNFLVVAYKELRRLEMAAQQAKSNISGQGEAVTVGVHLSNFYGIEIDDFAHATAQLSLWLAQHQMNKELFDRFGKVQPTLPLSGGGNIVLGNALHLDWDDVCPKSAEDEVYVCGNPPFSGANSRTSDQNASMDEVFKGFRTYKYLDFVACWFWKGTQFIAGTCSELGLVSTNSIAQGVQVSVLWPRIIDKRLTIKFAYQAFQWKNSARDNAGVHVVIIGLTPQSYKIKRLVWRVAGENREIPVSNITPYLVPGINTVVTPRQKPFRNCVPPMMYGNKPTDGGYLLLTRQERDELIQREPESARWLKTILGAEEFMNGRERYCLWLVDISDQDLAKMPSVMERIERVRETRLASRDTYANTILAERPHQFKTVINPDQFLLIPRITSERREYVPAGFFGSDVVCNDKNYIVPDASLYEFSILQSRMHMDWLKLVGGRLESRYSYSITVVYNTFPWPDFSDERRQEIEALGEEVLLAREDTPEWTMAEMYDPEKMPDVLRKAHRQLDISVEKLYRDKPFESQAERQEYLLARYAELVKKTEEAA